MNARPFLSAGVLNSSIGSISSSAVGKLSNLQLGKKKETQALFVAAFFSFDKDFQPVFIDYCLMSHADYTVQQFISPLLALCCTDCV